LYGDAARYYMGIDMAVNPSEMTAIEVEEVRREMRRAVNCYLNRGILTLDSVRLPVTLYEEGAEAHSTGRRLRDLVDGGLLQDSATPRLPAGTSTLRWVENWAQEHAIRTAAPSIVRKLQRRLDGAV